MTSLCVLAVFLIDVQSKKKMPPKAKRLLTESRRRWEKEPFVHYDLGAFMLFPGFLAECVFVSVFPALLWWLPFVYLTLTILAHYHVRTRMTSVFWIVLFAFWVSVSSTYFSCVALHDPELLSRIFGDIGITVEVSGSISYLFFPWLQLALILSSALLLGHTWRSRLLLRNGLSSKDLQDRYELVLERSSTMPWASEFSEVFSDVPGLLSLFEQGNFVALVGLGWGMVDRGLALVSLEKHIKPRALDIGIPEKEFDSSYDARNKMAHEGKMPTHVDALNLLLLVKHILERLGEKKIMIES